MPPGYRTRIEQTLQRTFLPAEIARMVQDNLLINVIAKSIRPRQPGLLGTYETKNGRKTVTLSTAISEEKDASYLAPMDTSFEFNAVHEIKHALLDGAVLNSRAVSRRCFQSLRHARNRAAAAAPEAVQTVTNALNAPDSRHAEEAKLFVGGVLKVCMKKPWQLLDEIIGTEENAPPGVQIDMESLSPRQRLAVYVATFTHPRHYERRGYPSEKYLYEMACDLTGLVCLFGRKNVHEFAGKFMDCVDERITEHTRTAARRSR